MRRLLTNMLIVPVLMVFSSVCFRLSAETASGKLRALSGSVTEYGTEMPVIGAAVQLGEDYLWTTTDVDGNFSFEKIQPGTYMLEVSCLGYVSVSVKRPRKQSESVRYLVE